MQETIKKKKKIVVGRRKTATVRVRIIDGDGKITVNKRKFEEYFPRPVHQIFVKKPLELLGLTTKFDVFAILKGGGITGQAEALKLGIVRALIQHNPDYRLLLAQNGLLTRDPRMVERKKYGRAGARKRFQFSKR
ncbi:MAG: 30S ribosomal protein S9 [Candidatus Firestonebacteria bacterium]|nr:30S ribosomal protein S9 [Candidatus Firestonebacteria bacterium]